MHHCLRPRFWALLLATIVLALHAVSCGDPKSGGAPATKAPEGATPTARPAAASGPVYAVFTQPSGTIRVRLAVAESPRMSMSFINLAERGYFTGRPWTDFSPVVRQLGDTMPVYSIPREFSPKLMHDVGGHLCVSNTSDSHDARAKPNRIFITVKPQDRWNLIYAVFGVVEEGLDVATRMQDGEKVASIRIEGDTSALRARFAKELVEWNKAIDAAMQAPVTPAAPPASTPSVR